jgi:hypothetical protein
MCMEKVIARFIQIMFHPLLISTMAIFILFRSNLYLAFIAEQIRQIVLLITVAFTCIIPLVFIIMLGVIKPYFTDKVKFPEVSVIYLFTAISYYTGYYFISKMPLDGFFKAAFLAATLVIIALSLISRQWKISSHMAGVGALAGSTIAIMLRLGVFNFSILSAVMIAGGLTGFSMLSLSKNNPAQVLAGYILGFAVLYSIFTFI